MDLSVKVITSYGPTAVINLTVNITVYTYGGNPCHVDQINVYHYDMIIKMRTADKGNCRVEGWSGEMIAGCDLVECVGGLRKT